MWFLFNITLKLFSVKNINFLWSEFNKYVRSLFVLLYLWSGIIEWFLISFMVKGLSLNPESVV